MNSHNEETEPIKKGLLIYSNLPTIEWTGSFVAKIFLKRQMHKISRLL